MTMSTGLMADNVGLMVSLSQLLKKMKRTLETERRNLRSVRERLSDELQNRTELQTFMRQCIEDVRKQIAEAQGELCHYCFSLRNLSHELISIPSRCDLFTFQGSRVPKWLLITSARRIEKEH